MSVRSHPLTQCTFFFSNTLHKPTNVVPTLWSGPMGVFHKLITEYVGVLQGKEALITHYETSHYCGGGQGVVIGRGVLLRNELMAEGWRGERVNRREGGV